MCEHCQKTIDAFDDIKRLALAALIEGNIDLTINQYTPPKLYKFLIAAHRTSEFHAECVFKSKL
jgi:hypothetical protein